MKKKMLKGLIAISIAISACFGHVGAVDAKPFSDVNKNDWFYYAVAMAEDVGYMSGYPDGTFRPNATITRAECAVVLSKVLNSGNYDWYSEGYQDVPTNAWYADEVAIAGSAMGGITQIDSFSQYPLTWFYPNQLCTREDFAYGLARVAEIRGRSSVLAHSGWSDYMEINEQYWPQIAGLYNLGIVSGSSDGAFHPKATITRAEVAQILSNFVQWNVSS